MDFLKRKSSKIWNFFTPIDHVSAKCDICKNVVSYKTSKTNLKRHMDRKHPTVNLNGDSGDTQLARNKNSKDNNNTPAGSSIVEQVRQLLYYR